MRQPAPPQAQQDRDGRPGPVALLHYNQMQMHPEGDDMTSHYGKGQPLIEASCGSEKQDAEYGVNLYNSINLYN